MVCMYCDNLINPITLICFPPCFSLEDTGDTTHCSPNRPRARNSTYSSTILQACLRQPYLPESRLVSLGCATYVRTAGYTGPTPYFSCFLFQAFRQAGRQAGTSIHTSYKTNAWIEQRFQTAQCAPWADSKQLPNHAVRTYVRDPNILKTTWTRGGGGSLPGGQSFIESLTCGPNSFRATPSKTSLKAT